jgi:hypothetical protein
MTNAAQKQSKYLPPYLLCIHCVHCDINLCRGHLQLVCPLSELPLYALSNQGKTGVATPQSK